MERSSSQSSGPEHAITKRFSGSRVLVAIAIGAAVGLALAYFLKVLIDNTLLSSMFVVCVSFI